MPAGARERAAQSGIGPIFSNKTTVNKNFTNQFDSSADIVAYQGGAGSSTAILTATQVTSSESNISDKSSATSISTAIQDKSGSDKPAKSKKKVATIAGAAIVICIAAALIAASMGAFNGPSTAPNNGANPDPNNNEITPTPTNNEVNPNPTSNETNPVPSNNETNTTQDKSNLVSTASAGNYTITTTIMGDGWTPGTIMVPSYMYSNANSSTNTMIYYNSTTETIAVQSTYVFVFNSIEDACAFMNSTIAMYGSSYTITNITSTDIGDVAYQTTSRT